MVASRRLMLALLVVVIASSGALASTQFPSIVQGEVSVESSPPFVTVTQKSDLDYVPRLTEVAANGTSYRVEHTFVRTRSPGGSTARKHVTETYWSHPDSERFRFLVDHRITVPPEQREYGETTTTRRFVVADPNANKLESYALRVYGSRFGPNRTPDLVGISDGVIHHDEANHRFLAYGNSSATDISLPARMSLARGAVSYIVEQEGFGLVSFVENGTEERNGTVLRRFDVIADSVTFDASHGEVLVTDSVTGYVLLDGQGRLHVADIEYRAHYQRSGEQFIWQEELEVTYGVDAPATPGWTTDIDDYRTGDSRE